MEHGPPAEMPEARKKIISEEPVADESKENEEKQMSNANGEQTSKVSVGQTSNGSGDWKTLEGATCVICNDVAHRKQAGVVTCESCRAFFRRASQGQCQMSHVVLYHLCLRE